MKKLLHIIATPRGKESRTLTVTGAFLEAFKTGHPDWTVEELDLSKEDLPSLTLKKVDGDYSAKETRAADFQEPYLRAIFGLVGITDISFVVAQPMDMGPELEKQKISDDQQAARMAVAKF